MSSILSSTTGVYLPLAACPAGTTVNASKIDLLCFLKPHVSSHASTTSHQMKSLGVILKSSGQRALCVCWALND